MYVLYVHYICIMYVCIQCIRARTRTRTQYPVRASDSISLFNFIISFLSNFHIYSLFYFHNFIAVRAQHTCPLFFLLLLLLLPFSQSARVRVRVRSTRTQYPVRVLTALYFFSFSVAFFQSAYAYAVPSTRTHSSLSSYFPGSKSSEPFILILPWK